MVQGPVPAAASAMRIAAGLYARMPTADRQVASHLARADAPSRDHAAGEHTMKILVIEDEEKTVIYLRKGFSEIGYVIDVARNCVDGQQLAVSGDYDAIVLDIMLPGRTGWAELENLRRQRGTAVLVLTARDRVEDRVRGLEFGADDYLVMPFAFNEFGARLRSIVRRGHSLEPEVLQVADLELDPGRHRVYRAGRCIDLTPKEFGLLYLLARHQGEVFSRTRIAEQVWDMNFDSDTNVVEVAERRLRAKLDDRFPVTLIHTVRGGGYVLELRP